mgnify:CR=1 FL=1
MSKKVRVLVIEPGKRPQEKWIDGTLQSYQREVNGYIQAIYPFADEVALICNEEGKLLGLRPNRALQDENGEIYEIIFGTFLITGLTKDNFGSLSEQLLEKYKAMFAVAEVFILVNGKVRSIPLITEDYDL